MRTLEIGELDDGHERIVRAPRGGARDGKNLDLRRIETLAVRPVRLLFGSSRTHGLRQPFGRLRAESARAALTDAMGDRHRYRRTGCQELADQRRPLTTFAGCHGTCVDTRKNECPL